ncbi:MAG TPA: transcription antitermination factor NusB [Vicinamibacteria bacterium]|nr:transcription antitermination factor NusB [Vicinamibacteria bacterium]
MGRRTRARECAFQMLYQWDMTREAMDNVIDSYWKVRSTTDLTRSMAERLARGAQGQVERIDEEITAVSKNWRFDRIAAVDRNIIRIGVFELVNDAETPSAVVIDEAVEMARRFGEADSTAFVNGVLDAIMRRVRRVGERVRGA